MGTLVPLGLFLLSPGSMNTYCGAIPGGLSSILQTSGFRRTSLSALNAKPFCAATIWLFRLATARYVGNAPDLPASRASIRRRRVRPSTVWALTFSRQCTSSACPWILSRAKTKHPIGIQRYSSSNRPDDCAGGALRDDAERGRVGFTEVSLRSEMHETSRGSGVHRKPI